MVTREGEAKILDFGIAKAAGGPDLTRTGTTVGTIAYMAPEHIRGGAGRRAERRLGAWRRALRDARPAAGCSRRPTTTQLLQAIVERPIPPLQAAGVSAELTGIVARALERDRGKRYANAGEMAQALERHLQHTSVDAVAVTTWSSAAVRACSRSSRRSS